MTRKYAVIFEQAETNWAPYVPDLPGCVSTGKTLEETERNTREAIRGHLHTLAEFWRACAGTDQRGSRNGNLSCSIRLCECTRFDPHPTGCSGSFSIFTRAMRLRSIASTVKRRPWNSTDSPARGISPKR